MKGIYVLIISVDTPLNVKIGALGKIFFEKGVYAYVGSAQNSLESRVERHLANDKVNFWHIDYLLGNKNTKIIDVFWKKADKSEECKVARKLDEKKTSIPNFGCSDCDCVSHLFMLGGPERSQSSFPSFFAHWRQFRP